MRLSQVFNILRGSRSSQPDNFDAGTARDSEHVVDRLAKLADMLDKGLLTTEEFGTLKAELLPRH